MTIRGRLFAAVLGAAIVAAPAEAQVRTVTFGVSAGPTIPIGDFGDAMDVGFHVQGSLHFGAPALPFGVRGDFMFHSLGASGVDATGNIIAGILNAVFPFGPQAAAPYALAGVGAYNFGGDFESQTELGINGGAGFQFGLGNMAAFAEARFHHLFNEGSAVQFIPISVGVIF